MIIARNKIDMQNVDEDVIGTFNESGDSDIKVICSKLRWRSFQVCAEKLPGNRTADLLQIFDFLSNREASEMIQNQFGNVSVLEKSEISRKILHGIIVGYPNFRFSGLDRKSKQ